MTTKIALFDPILIYFLVKKIKNQDEFIMNLLVWEG